MDTEHPEGTRILTVDAGSVSRKVTPARTVRSLRTLVALGIVAGQVIAVLALAVPVIEGRESIIYHQARQMALARARLGATLLEQDRSRLTQPRMDAALRAFLTSPDILEARIVSGGSVVARAAAGGPGPEPLHAPVLEETGQGFLVKAPLDAAGRDARLEFSFCTAYLAEQVSRVTTRVAILVCAVLAAGLLAAYALSLTVIRRLERIADVTAALAGGDLAQRLPEEGTAELAALSRSFNAMVDALVASRQALLDTNATLEQKVEQRTRDLVEAHGALVEAERLGTVGAMSAQLAHDLRNPLAVAVSNVELIGEELSGCTCAQRADNLIAATHRALARADLALAEYLGFTGLSGIQRATADLNALISTEVSSLAEWLRSRGVKTALELARDLRAVSLDGRRFRLAIRCLARHAVDAMRDGGTLTFATVSDPVAVTLRVSDTGEPIDEAVRHDLFKLFRGPRPNSGGPGLRLAREIAVSHGGSLELESTGPAGSTFRLVLPLAPARDAAA